MKRKGFTLLETVAAMLLVGIVSASIFSGLNNTQKYMARTENYARALYIALEDVNSGIEKNVIQDDFERITTITEDNGIIIVKTIVRGRIGMEEVEVELVRYKEDYP